MSIHKLVKLGAGALLAVMAVCAITFFFAISSIKIGGERDRGISEVQLVVADVAPPPLYVVEAYKEVLKAVAIPGNDKVLLDNLAELKREYDQSQKRWSQSELLTPEMKAKVFGPAKQYADQFWSAVAGKLLPAIRRGDRAATDAALEEVDGAFEQHHVQAKRLIEELSSFADGETAAATRFTFWISLLLVGLGLALIGGTVVAARALMRRVVAPIGDLASATSSLAEGTPTAVPGLDRPDELGELAKAVDFFRRSAAERAERDARDGAEKKAMIDDLAGALTRMAEGDLRSLLDKQFEGDFGPIGVNLNSAITALRNMIQSVVESATSIREGAEGIADASSDLATRTQSNAAAIEQTTAALAGVDQRVASSRDAARSTAQSAERAHRAVEQGLAKAQAAAAAMEEVKAAAATVDEVMEALDKIAFQTRVLAMNAAIEAGAAGAAGKGFAVVAGLVSQLASRAEAEANEAREQLTATAARIADAVGSVGEVEREFEGIVAEVSSVTGLVEQLSQDAHAQAGAVAEISAAMRQMDISTQQNAAMVEETSAAAGALLGEAEGLVEQAQNFKWNRRQRNIPVPVERRGQGARAGQASAWGGPPELMAAE